MKRNRAILGIAVGGWLAIRITGAVAAGDTPAATAKLISTVLVAEKAAVALGEPVRVTVHAEYHSGVLGIAKE